MEFAAVAQKLSQEHLQSLLASRVVVEPCYADPSLLGTLSGKEPLVTDDIEDKPEDTTVTVGGSSWSHSQNMRHNALQKKVQE